MAYLPSRNRKTGKMTLRYVAPKTPGTVAPRSRNGQWGRRLVADGTFHVTKGPR